MDDRRRHLERVAGTRDSGQVCFVRSVGAEPRHDLVSLCDLVEDLMPARRRRGEDLERLLQPLSPGRNGERRWAVVDEIRRDDLIDYADVQVVDLGVEATNQ